MRPIDFFYDFLMGITIGSLCITILYFFRKKMLHTGTLSLRGVIILYGLFSIRAIVPIEFPFSVSIKANALKPLAMALLFSPIYICQKSFLGYQILFAAYYICVICLIIRLIVYYIRANRQIKAAIVIKDFRIIRIFNLVTNENKKINVELREMEGITSPLSMGIFNPVIVLPKENMNDYSDEDIYNMLKHEYTHMVSHDPIIILFVNLICCFLFWNPCIELFRRDFLQALELRCDKSVIKDMGLKSKIKYMETMLKVLKKTDSLKRRTGNLFCKPALSLVSNMPVHITERFDAISRSKGSKASERKIALPLLATILVISSYVFIFQAEFDPPIEDIIDSTDCYEINFDKDYLIIEADGEVNIVFGNGSSTPAVSDDIQWFEENGGKIVYK